MVASAPLSATDLTVVRGGRAVFAGLSLRVEPGEALRLAGRNGGGKSTVLRVLAGLLRPVRGAVAWDGVAVARDWHAHARRLAYLGHADALKSALSARENARTALAILGRPDAGLDAAFAALDLQPLAELPVGWLSAGQRRRVALARVLAAEAPLWLLDEPSVGLDSAAAAALERAIADHRATGGMVIAASHIALDLGGGEAVVDPADFAPGAEEVWA